MYVDEYILFNRGNTMLESVIPSLIYFGIKSIYTYGYDGPKLGNYMYYNNIINNTIIECESEYTILKYIVSMLNKNNIYLYKCSINSQADLPLIDIYNIFE